MGQTLRKSRQLRLIAANVEQRQGRISYSARWHNRKQKLFQDDYSIDGKNLGAGSNGVVQQATCKVSSRKVAVKSFALKGIGNEEMDFVRSEVENHLSMDHPHIVRLLDVYESKRELQLVMERMEGRDLLDQMQEKKKFSEEEASKALRQLLLALNYMHSNNTAHRDVKLENCMYDTEDCDHLKLLDLGFSTQWDSNSGEELNKSCGTLSYCAPDVLQGHYTSQCDMWSLGVVGYILLSGVMPFNGIGESGARAIRRNISLGKYYSMESKEWVGVSEPAKEFIRSLLHVDPCQRLSAKAALEHPWIAKSHVTAQLTMAHVVEGLCEYSHLSTFRRHCWKVWAWTSPNKEQAVVRDDFLAINTSNQGSITLSEFRHFMADHAVKEKKILEAFVALDYNKDQTIHYSEFLAAMLSSQVARNTGEVRRSFADTMRIVFRTFDPTGSGRMTAANIHSIIGAVDDASAASLVAEVDHRKQGYISLEEFSAYIEGNSGLNKPRSLRKVLSNACMDFFGS